MNITANATDPDGDAVTLEYEGATADSYYAPGTHTVKVRAKDIAGAYSPWTEKSFTITASSTDPDGDSVTRVWEGRNAETQPDRTADSMEKSGALDLKIHHILYKGDY